MQNIGGWKRKQNLNGVKPGILSSKQFKGVVSRLWWTLELEIVRKSVWDFKLGFLGLKNYTEYTAKSAMLHIAAVEGRLCPPKCLLTGSLYSPRIWGRLLIWLVISYFSIILNVIYIYVLIIYIYIYIPPWQHQSSTALCEGKTAEEKGQKLLRQAGEKEVRQNSPQIQSEYQSHRPSSKRMVVRP